MGAPAGEEALLVVQGEDGREGGESLLAGRRRRWMVGSSGCESRRRWRKRREAIGDLIRDDNRAVVSPGQRAQKRAEANELGGAVCEGGGRMGNMALGPLRAVIRRDGINDAEPDSVAREGDGELVGQDMILRFQIGGLQSEDAGERGW